MKPHEQTTQELQTLIDTADAYRFSAEDERCRDVRNFYEMRGMHRRGLIGDNALATAFKTAIAATKQPA